MREIKLIKNSIFIPENWEELTKEQLPVVFRNLMLLFAGEITPFECQFNMLREFTGYRPKKYSPLMDFIRMVIYSKKKFRDYVLTRHEQAENIRFNLIRLAEQIDFAFSVKANRIEPDFSFRKNPFGSRSSVYFDRDVTVETNITSRQFTDCVDMLRGYYQVNDDAVRRRLMIKIMATLYRADENRIARLPVEVHFGVMYWFQSVVKFFRDHPVFGMLYDRKGSEYEDITKADLGMSEVLLYLEKEGYRMVEERNVIEFFNMQLKSLKDSVNAALSAGIKMEDLAKKTGLSINTINRLSNE